MQNYNLKKKAPPQLPVHQGHQQHLIDSVYILPDLWFAAKLIYPIHAFIF